MTATHGIAASTDGTQPTDPQAPRGTSDPVAAMMRRLAVPARRRGRVSLGLAIGWLALVILAAVCAGLLPIETPSQILADPRPRTGPRWSLDEPLGTDALGRSVLSRLVYGARQSLIVGVVSVAIALALGLILGLLAGYLRGRVDTMIRVVLDAMLSIPALVVLLAIASVGQRDLKTIVLGLSLVFTPTFARLVRANTLALARHEFVTAARAMGATNRQIIVRELLPNVVLPVSSYAFLVMASAIVTEGSLSFLGLGIPPPAPSWGGMVAAGRQFLQQSPHLVFVPAGCLVLTVISFTVVGDWARRRFDDRESALG